jgi:hypothetical protein
MNEQLQISTRRGRITLVLIAMVLIAIAGGMILVVSVARQYSFVAAGALITAWATLGSAIFAQLATTWRAADRARVEALQAADRAEVEALQAYLKEIGELLSKKPGVRDPTSADDHDLRMLARAHTSTVLSILNSDREDLVIRYLRDVQLLDALELYHPDNSSAGGETATRIIEVDEANSESPTPIDDAVPGTANLQDTDVRGARLAAANLTTRNLEGASFIGENLTYANLQAANLKGASLDGANLSNANLRSADLRGAHLGRADLRKADLSEAILRFADLNNAWLLRTCLSGAVLQGAVLRGADLRSADLRDAPGVTKEQLEEQAKMLEGTIMPDGQKYEDWLKSRSHGGNGENPGPS